MADTAAFQATVHGFRTIPSRGVVSITVEAPIEEHARIAEIAEHGAWVAVARLSKEGNPPSKTLQQLYANVQEERKKPNPLAQRIAMTCNEPAFATFLSEKMGRSGDVAANVRKLCGVQSRKEILPGTDAAQKWDELHGKYLGWQRGL